MPSSVPRYDRCPAGPRQGVAAARQPNATDVPQSISPSPTLPVSEEFEAALASRRQVGSTKVRMLRGWRRSEVQIEAVIVSGGRRQKAVIRDLSRYGAGLVVRGFVQLSEEVVIETSIGLTIRARIRWRVADRLGVAFDHPLAAVAPKQKLGNHSGLLDALRRMTWQRLGHVSIRWLATARRGIREFARRTREWSRARAGRHERAMIQRACRRQGFAWLVEEDGDTAAKPYGTDTPHGLG